MRSQTRDPHRPALEYVSRPMQAIGIVFFKWHGSKYLLLMDHFSGMLAYKKMGYSTDTEHTVKQLKKWIATFGVSWSIRCYSGLSFFSRGFKEFCNEYCIWLDLTSPYNPESSGARKALGRADQADHEEDGGGGVAFGGGHCGLQEHKEQEQI